MGKYIKLFGNHNDYLEFTKTEDFALPNVSHCETQNDVHYNPNVRMTTAVHGYIYSYQSPLNVNDTINKLYVEEGYMDFIQQIRDDAPEDVATYLDENDNEVPMVYWGLLVCHDVDTDTNEKIFICNDNDYKVHPDYYIAEYSDVSEVPSSAREVYLINYLYILQDILGRSMDRTVDISNYLQDYSFLHKVREDMFFGGGGNGNPPVATTWAWKGQCGQRDKTYVSTRGMAQLIYSYVLPETLFNSFCTDLATYYNISVANTTDDAYEPGLQVKDFIIYFEDEEKAYHCFINYGNSETADTTEEYTKERSGGGSYNYSAIDSETLQNCYLAGFMQGTTDGKLVSLDISDFVASLSSDSPYLEHLEQINTELLR